MIAKIIKGIAYVAFLLLLAGNAYLGLAGAVALPTPDIILAFGAFYGIFNAFTWANIMVVLPLVVGIIFSIFCAGKNKTWIVALCVIEAILVLVFLLCGFGVIK